MRGQPTSPIIIQLPDGPTPETGVAEVLIGALGLTGVFIVGTIIAGIVIGALLFGLRKLRPEGSDGGQRLGL